MEPNTKITNNYLNCHLAWYTPQPQETNAALKKSAKSFLYQVGTGGKNKLAKIHGVETDGFFNSCVPKRSPHLI